MKAVVSLGVMSLLLSSPAVADPQCKPVTGHFEARVVPPPDCTAPFCTAGRVWGGVQGNYSFAMTTIEPSGAVPSIMFFTGLSAIALRSGDLLNGTDTGTLDLGPAGGFASIITFTGGTGDFTGATGQIKLRGQLDQAARTTTGDYAGTLCKP